MRLDMAGLGFRSALWRTIERARHDYPVLLGELRRQQWLPREEVEAVQRRRLIRLLQHAFENVPYYRAVLGSAGVVRGDGSVHLERFTEIEPLSRQVVIREGQNLWSRTASPRECHLNASGGSTGEPVRHLQDRVRREYGLAVKALFDEWTGYRVGRRQVRLWGSERDLGVANESLKRRVGRWLRSELWLNAFRMDETRMREYVRRINAFRPYQLLGYANSLYELATFVQREGLDVHAPGAVMSSAGTLFPHMRERIEGVFRAPVFNRYGSREVGDVACECERHRGLHVCTPTHLIEVLGPDGGPVGPGEVGEVVVTLLTNHAMPLIRYRIGDMAAWAEEECPCGRTWPLLREVAGRVTDVFYRADGGVVLPEAFIHLIGVVVRPRSIRQFQVVQRSYDQVVVRAVVWPEMASSFAEECEKIAWHVRHLMGPECRVEFEVVDELRPTPSGKFRYTVSEVAPSHV